MRGKQLPIEAQLSLGKNGATAGASAKAYSLVSWALLAQQGCFQGSWKGGHGRATGQGYPNSSTLSITAV